MAKTCESCERPLRKGKARRAWVLDGHGGLKQGIVCTRCALRAVSVVVPKPTTVPTTCVLCKRELACVCRGCYNGAASNVRELSAANVALRQTNTLGDDGQQRDPCGNVVAPSDADFDHALVPTEQQRFVARAHYDLLRAIRDGAGHSVRSTGGVLPLLDEGLVREDGPDKSFPVEITPLGTTALALVRHECEGNPVHDHRRAPAKPTVGTPKALIAPEAIPNHVPIRSVRTYTVRGTKKPIAVGVSAEEACEAAADAGGHLTIIDDTNGLVVVSDTDGDIATIASLEALLHDYESQARSCCAKCTRPLDSEGECRAGCSQPTAESAHV